jgi:hypothetical protein
MNNNIDINLDEIRQPDPVKRETLIEQFDNFNNMYNNNFDNNIFEDIDDNYNQYDIEFHRVLQLSRDEYEIVAQQNENERRQRVGILLNIKQRLLRVKGFDMDNNKIYEMIISIIEMYEKEKINTLGVDKENYNAIFNVIQLIRFEKDEIELLKDIIVQL